jgi:hypothetical protein
MPCSDGHEIPSLATTWVSFDGAGDLKWYKERYSERKREGEKERGSEGVMRD